MEIVWQIYSKYTSFKTENAALDVVLILKKYHTKDIDNNPFFIAFPSFFMLFSSSFLYNVWLPDIEYIKWQIMHAIHKKG